MQCVPIVKCGPDGPVLVVTDGTTTQYFDLNVDPPVPITPDPATLTFPGCGANAASSMTLNEDGTFTHDAGDGSDPVIIDVCATLGELDSTGLPVPAGVEVLGNDCQWHVIPAGGTDTFSTYAPGTGADAGSVVITAPDGTEWKVCEAPCTSLELADNSDGTGSITDTDAGLTCIFPGQKLNKCDDTAFAKGDTVRVVAQENLTDLIEDEDGDKYGQNGDCVIVVDEASTEAAAPAYASPAPTPTRRIVVHDLNNDCDRHIYVTGLDENVYPLDVPQWEHMKIQMEPASGFAFPDASAQTEIPLIVQGSTQVSPNDPYLEFDGTGGVVVTKRTGIIARGGWAMVAGSGAAGGVIDPWKMDITIAVNGGQRARQKFVVDRTDGISINSIDTNDPPYIECVLIWTVNAGDRISVLGGQRTLGSGQACPVLTSNTSTYLSVARISDIHL